MKHSSKQHEREQEFAQQNKEYVESKRDQLRELKGAEEKKKRGFKNNKFCCMAIVFIVSLAFGLIYYFIMNIKGPIYEDYLNKKEQAEQLIPEKTDEIKQGIEQGEDLYNETMETIEDLQAKYKRAKELYEQGQETIEKVNEIKEKLEALQES